ncbi:MAG: hypothetical protein H7844_03540 [Nitrospirae bacterium YQR-1]
MNLDIKAEELKTVLEIFNRYVPERGHTMLQLGINLGNRGSMGSPHKWGDP